jgi:hypothetical protein
MKFYKYWARGEALVHDDTGAWPVYGYDGSDDSLDEAIRRANDRAEKMAVAIEHGRASTDYGYMDRPVREEVLQEIHDSSGLAAAITRNSYGSLVLNTCRAMFIDVDIPPAIFGDNIVRTLWYKLRGKSVPNVGDMQLQRIKNVGRLQPNLGYRVYRTCLGFRVLVTSDVFDPLSEETRKLLTAFGSDRLYTRLCNVQKCFRARLSAKYWRCGAPKPPSRFPWQSTNEEQAYRQWEEEYHRHANQFATCQLIAAHGPAAVSEATRPIVELHDRLTLLDGAPLA